MNELALFAGAGGGILGGKLLGWRTVCAVERDAYAAAVLAQRQNDGSLDAFPIWSDVETFDGTPWRGIVDVVSGGFPCQDISVAGKGAGIKGERSGLWAEFARIIGEVRPGTHSLKTAQCLLFEDSTAFCAILPRWGSMQNGAVYQDMTPATKRTGSGCGLLRRPLYSDHKFYVLTKQQMITRRSQSKTPMNWMQQAIELSDLNKAWANVRFAEHLMRWPTDWTDLELSETGKTHIAQRQHGAC